MPLTLGHPVFMNKLVRIHSCTSSPMYLMLTEFTQQRLPKYGVTSFLASTVFPRDLEGSKMFETLEILEEIVGKTDRGATCEGIHAEVDRGLGNPRIEVTFVDR